MELLRSSISNVSSTIKLDIKPNIAKIRLNNETKKRKDSSTNFIDIDHLINKVPKINLFEGME